MTRSLKLRFVVAALAIATVAATAPSAFAFSTENLNVNQNGNSKLADPDSQVKNGQTTTPFGPSGPSLHFGSSTNRAGGSSNGPPPNPYAMPPGNN
jgi:hypothetical protein